MKVGNRLVREKFDLEGGFWYPLVIGFKGGGVEFV